MNALIPKGDVSEHRDPAALPSSLQNSYQLRCLSTVGFDQTCFDHLHKSNIQPLASWEFNPKAWIELLGKWRATAQSLFREICCFFVACVPPLPCNSLHQQNPSSRIFTFITCLAHPCNSLIRTLSAPHPLLMVASVECILAKVLSTSSAWSFSYQAHHLGNDFIPQLYFGFRDFIPDPLCLGPNTKPNTRRPWLGPNRINHWGTWRLTFVTQSSSSRAA